MKSGRPKEGTDRSANGVSSSKSVGVAHNGVEDGSKRSSSSSSSSRKASPNLPTYSEIENLEETIHSKFGIAGEVAINSYPLVAALCRQLEQTVDELDSCKHQAKLLKSSNERLIRENEQLLRSTEKQDKHIRELQAQLERLLRKEDPEPGPDSQVPDVITRLQQENTMLKKERDHLLAQAAATTKRSPDGDDDRFQTRSISMSLSGRHETTNEIRKLRSLEDHVDTLQREKELLERQLRTEKDEAGRKLEELAESVNVSIKSIVQERETMMKKNQELSHKLQAAEAESNELKQQANRLKEECEALRRTHTYDKLNSPPTKMASQDLEDSVRLLTAELEHTSRLVTEKDSIIQQLQAQLHQMRGPSVTRRDFRNEQDHQQLLMQLHETKREKQKLELQMLELHTASRRIEEERNRLSVMLSERGQRFDDYDEMKTAFHILEQKFQVQSDTLATRERELERARKLIEELSAKETRLQRSCNELTLQVSSLSQQLNDLSHENEDGAAKIRQLLEDAGLYQKKCQKKEAKLVYIEQLLNTKEKELQDMLASNRRLNDLSTMLKQDLDESRQECSSLSQAITDARQKLQHAENALRGEQQRCKRYEELFEIERRKAEESREVREHLQRHITKWEAMNEELGLLHRSKELQEGEMQRLRKDNESLRKERDKMNARILELNQAAESAKSTVTVQDMTISRLEEDKASLKDYVLKYETELSKHEVLVAQLTADLQQMETYCEFLERTNQRMEELVTRMNDNASDRDRLLQEFDRLQRSLSKHRASSAASQPPAAAIRTPRSSSPSSPVYQPYSSS